MSTGSSMAGSIPPPASGGMDAAVTAGDRWSRKGGKGEVMRLDVDDFAKMAVGMGRWGRAERAIEEIKSVFRNNFVVFTVPFF
jgi:hypothetical protein